MGRTSGGGGIEREVVEQLGDGVVEELLELQTGPLNARLEVGLAVVVQLQELQAHLEPLLLGRVGLDLLDPVQEVAARDPVVGILDSVGEIASKLVAAPLLVFRASGESLRPRGSAQRLK
jgi:hypothetical protein